MRSRASQTLSTLHVIISRQAPDGVECLLQKPDGERCSDKVHQVSPPIELYERIIGFAKLCHKAVNHCRTRLEFYGAVRRKGPRGC